MHHQDWEVYVRGLGQDVDEDTIVRLFKNNQVKIIQVKLPRDNEGIPQGYAFVLCLNESEKQKALSLSNVLTLNQRTLSIEEKNNGRR